MKTKSPNLAFLREKYQLAKSIGSPALACNAVLVPDNFPNLQLLFQNFTRPMVTMNDAADVDYAWGLAAHTPGVAKTNYEGSVTAIETETGQIANFAQWLVDNGGEIPSCTVIFGGSDGTVESGAILYKIEDVAVTFDGGGDIDSSSRSQILTVQGNMRYMYFGKNADLGVAGKQAFASLNQSLRNNSGINNAIDGLVQLAMNGFN